MKSERNKTLNVVVGFKFRFHKFLKNVFNVGLTQLTLLSIFNDIYICVDNFNNYNHPFPFYHRNIKKQMNQLNLNNS